MSLFLYTQSAHQLHLVQYNIYDRQNCQTCFCIPHSHLHFVCIDQCDFSVSVIFALNIKLQWLWNRLSLRRKKIKIESKTHDFTALIEFSVPLWQQLCWLVNYLYEMHEMPCNKAMIVFCWYLYVWCKALSGEWPIWKNAQFNETVKKIQTRADKGRDTIRKMQGWKM